MFKTEVATLPISRDILGLWFFRMEGTRVTRVTPDNTVGDLFTPLDSKSRDEQFRIYHPDYAILGYYTPPTGEFGQVNRDFFLQEDEENNTHILYVTGVPKGQKFTGDLLKRSKYRIEDNVDFFHYWEDTHHGYLIQIVRLK